MNDYKIEFITDYHKWDRQFQKISKPNISQSWCYGEAKMKSQGWKILRGVIKENDNPVALIQAWYKKILCFKFVRVSFGPLWLTENPSYEQISGTFQSIKSQWRFTKLNILSIAPNLENTPENNKIRKELVTSQKPGAVTRQPKQPEQSDLEAMELAPFE